jgi:hypothetical protein
MKHLSVLIVVLLFTDDVKFLLLFCFRLAIFPSPQLLSSLEVLVVFIQMWEWGVGAGGAGEAGEAGEAEEERTIAQCPMPNAQCPMPNPQSPITNN